MRDVPSNRRARPGFSLIELVTSLGVLTTITLGLASALMLAARAIPTAERPNAGVRTANAVANRLAEELTTAIQITERRAGAIRFVLADRDGDALPEVVRYLWSGTPGDPLHRFYNGGPGVVVVDDVREFRLAYDLEAATESYPGPLVQSPEMELSSYAATTSLNYLDITPSKWCRQRFRPSLSPAAASWGVTRVLFSASTSSTPDGLTMVQLRPIDATGDPDDLVLAQQPLDEASLTGSFEWHEVTFNDVRGLSVNEGLCVVFEGVQGDSARLEFDAGGAGLLETGDAGVTWSDRGSQSLRYSVYGRVMNPGQKQSVTRQYVTSAHLTLVAGGADETITAISMLNRPELLSAYWEVDFDADPTALDLDADGSGDWTVRNGSFDPVTLIDGIWYADATLDTRPLNGFNEITTVDVRMRNTSRGGNGTPVFWLNYDYGPGELAVVNAYLVLQPNATQTLTVHHKTSTSVQVPLVTVHGLSEGFVDLRLLIDPQRDTVNVRVNGEDQGTYRNPSFAETNSDQFATILPWSSDAEFDFVRIRVGGQ